MSIESGRKVLRGKYELISQLMPDHSMQPSEAWLAVDDYQTEYIIKLWPFQDNGANELQRALWDFELRNLYRVSSSPGAEQVLLVVHDAGVDFQYGCFVMVMQARGAGYDNLGQALKHRNQYDWLSDNDVEQRQKVWRGLKQIAQGVQLLHSQAILHRNVNADNVFFHPDSGAKSFRLGGFEWSIRIGELHVATPPHGWSSPPEIEDWESFGYQIETDWYGFGILAARCFINIEAYVNEPPIKRHQHINQKIKQATERYLSDIEKHIILRLIDRNRRDRLTRDDEVVAIIDELIQNLQGVQPNIEDKPLVVVYDSRNSDLAERVAEVGFIPNPKNPHEAFNPYDINHSVNLSHFIQNDLKEAQIFYLNDKDYILVGQKLALKITRYKKIDFNRSQPDQYSWDAAYVLDVVELSWSEGGNAQKELPPESIIVRTGIDIRNQPTTLSKSQSWKRHLPQKEKSASIRASLALFHDFIRCTNQIDLLIRDAELFLYERVSRKVVSQVEIVKIREIARERTVMDIFKLEGGLVGFLQREFESNKPNCDLVVLTPEGQGSLRLNLEKRIEPKDCYQVVSFEKDEDDNDVIVLKKIASANSVIAPPVRGWLRTFGMFGQVDLIRRRKEAIDRLAEHSYLLKSLAATGQVYMHIGQSALPRELPNDKVDIAKQAVMQDVLNTRPIYALQGPPGTGKTTMVAYLLRQILDADPVAQILVTAQAHGAVDVLRSKVLNEAFVDVAEASLPLAVRLGRNDPDKDLLEGSVESVAVRVLQLSVESLKNKPMTKLQQKWIDYASEMIDAIHTRTLDKQAPEFVELVKRGANITYCTTSAGDLEELARSTQAYDWTIIEEAGKCHGFDLALPMQAGHRWLLIGDHHQLPPYRFDDYLKAITDLERTVGFLNDLPENASGLLDIDWLRRWEATPIEEQESFKQFAKDRLETFRFIFELCEKTPAGESSLKRTLEEPIGAIAGMLSWQYRMHPTIGDLISESYYRGALKNKTTDPNGKPLERVKLALKNPEKIGNVSIVWIDCPSALGENKEAKEWGPPDSPRYTNPYEADIIKGLLTQLKLDIETIPFISQENPLKLAVLSPYNQQVSCLRRVLKDIKLPPGIVPKEELRHRATDNSFKNRSLVHTVDSFQGNEADIIIVSLVRNNEGRGRHPLGFLDKAERMNVLFSRAQRLLVLVGSWDFFYKQVEPFNLNDPSRTEWHLKKAMTLVERWFSDNTAVKLNGENFISEVTK
ncbi:MAG: AAA family ATPase [Tissierellales bacterium]|nr:AAA family ATPase [Tissierellales bacterium]